MAIPTEPGLYVGWYNRPPTKESVTGTPFPDIPIPMLFSVFGRAPYLKCYMRPLDFTYDESNLPIVVDPPDHPDIIFGSKVELPELPEKPVVPEKKSSILPRTASQQAAHLAHSCMTIAAFSRFQSN